MLPVGGFHNYLVFYEAAPDAIRILYGSMEHVICRVCSRENAGDRTPGGEASLHSLFRVNARLHPVGSRTIFTIKPDNKRGGWYCCEPSMNQKLIAEIGKSQRLEIINKLKRTQGLSVGELAEQLEMSYMGVKQHCVDLETEGYLDTWRRSKGIGRPELLYRLTERAHDLFPVASNGMTIALLENAKALYGPAAAEKLLFSVFQKKAETYKTKVRGETIAERAGKLTRVRDSEGCMAECEHEAACIRIVEHHCPIRDLLKAFPIVARLEAELFTRVLGAAVHREEAHASGLYRCVFTLNGGGMV